jgi:predicted DsbA family dithiol-disulfide isomerase
MVPMSQDQSRSRPPLFSQIDVSQASYAGPPHQAARNQEIEQVRLLRELLAAQDRQNELLEEMVSQLSTAQKQRATELGQWKQANPRLARNCRLAAEALGRVQTEFLESLTQEITANYENLLDGEFMLNEFVDRFGPRMAHLNGLLQVLSQLSATANPTNTPNTP